MKQILTFITFLLLSLPAWKSCNSNKVTQKVQVECPTIDTLDIKNADPLDVSYNEVDTVSADNNIEVAYTAPKETAFDNFLKIFEWDENCKSGYRLLWKQIEFFKKEKKETTNTDSKDEIKTESKDIKDGKINSVKDIVEIFVSFGLVFSFIIYFLISITLVIFSFTKKRKTFIWLSGINFFIIIWAYISYFFVSSNYYQIKFGFYLLIINSLLILLSNFAKKIQSRRLKHF